MSSSEENVRMESNAHTLRGNVHQLKIRFDKLHEEVILKLTECSHCTETAKNFSRETIQVDYVIFNSFV
jgi:predicted nuclease with TOPRIM domain